MTACRATGFLSILCGIILLAACETMESVTSGGAGPSATSVTSTKVPAAKGAATSVVASGTEGDSLESCLSRIPKESSAGQRMLADASCQRDHAGRKPIDIVPGPRAK